jgi:rabenosyn-5
MQFFYTSSTFHSLTNRKHHCRTCGRVICSLPIKPPARTRPCSLLFVIDEASGCIEEVVEGVDYGVRRRNGQDNQTEEKFLKGVRICQDCRPVLLRKQYELESGATPLYVRLYKVQGSSFSQYIHVIYLPQQMISLEHEIEENLSQYENMLSSESPLVQTSTLRESLLGRLAEYEALAKEIQHLPIKGDSGNSQERIQKSIAVRAGLFLQKKMLPLKVSAQVHSAVSDSNGVM